MKIKCGAVIILDDEVEKNIPKTGWWINSYGYAVYQKVINGKKINTYLHHTILPVKKGFDADHINRNKLDNRKSNLRYVTRSQNIINMAPKKNNKSGHTGVIWEKRKMKWRAYIGGVKKRVELGCFIKKSDAVKARLMAEKEYFYDIYG